MSSVLDEACDTVAIPLPPPPTGMKVSGMDRRWTLGLVGLVAFALVWASPSSGIVSTTLWASPASVMPNTVRPLTSAPQPVAQTQPPARMAHAAIASRVSKPVPTMMARGLTPHAVPLAPGPRRSWGLYTACLAGVLLTLALGLRLQAWRALHKAPDRIVMTAVAGDGEIKVPDDFKPPEPKTFALPKGEELRVLLAALPAVPRLYLGIIVNGWAPSVANDDDGGQQYSIARLFGKKLVEKSTTPPATRPEQPLQLWEFQGCPYCRKVREAITFLDLDVQFFPCPKDGPTYRADAKGTRGWKTFPHMIDPNTGADLASSGEIIDYLFEIYGGGAQVPFLLGSNPLNMVTLFMAALLRIGPGSSYVASRKPAKPLELWAYEPSPFSVIARETLSELELPHILHPCARGSANRDALVARAGRFQVPYLEDPNTGVKMFESTAIAKYLYDVYALPK
uniref:GST N-terminal domain-containing protein n=1 Tax=Eutreptiella gymnastica TaxID=73025 RepID=A0A7S1N935_9EUGL